jgi:hypothetical protein
VVVTPPLKLWHTFRSLELAYRDAYYNQLNDRYRARRNEYRELARWAAEKLFVTGIGFAWDPVPRAASPTLRPIVGSLAAGTYFVTMCWVGATGQEGASAPPQAIELPIAGGIAVKAPEAPSNGAGWNVYIGASEDLLIRQNQTAIGSSEQWLQSDFLSASGATPSNGPEAGIFRPAPRVIQRG